MVEVEAAVGEMAVEGGEAAAEAVGASAGEGEVEVEVAVEVVVVEVEGVVGEGAGGE